MITATDTESQFQPDYIVPPGETIADLLDEHDMTQTELARRLGVSLKHINQIIKGSAAISAEIALGLEKVLGPSAVFGLLERRSTRQGWRPNRSRRNSLGASPGQTSSRSQSSRSATSSPETRRALHL